MIIGKKYKILGEYYSYRPDLQPEGTIVKCIKNENNNFFTVKLIDKCGKKIEKGIGGWLINTKKTFYQEIS